MNSRKVAAQFAAYAWYEESRAGHNLSPNEATRFAKENWSAFLPVVQKGLGRLLIRIAWVRAKRQRMQKRSRCLAATV